MDFDNAAPAATAKPAPNFDALRNVRFSLESHIDSLMIECAVDGVWVGTTSDALELAELMTAVGVVEETGAALDPLHGTALDADHIEYVIGFLRLLRSHL